MILAWHTAPIAKKLRNVTLIQGTDLTHRSFITFAEILPWSIYQVVHYLADDCDAW